MSHDDPGKENNDKVAEIAAIEERLQVLRVEHRALDLSLQEIEKHLSLTSQEQQEVARIKKQKLHKKDEISHIETLLAQLTQQNPANS
ncbi:YdcH family protein [Myxococcota bacterium]|nr:YdcH family protein [Myxococcota bacterium]MBU1412310.1 YdcH family protein [Myxococcota bacterium]MBU1509152.1 YdcH family protein [Myxococcota bacterium]